MVDAVSTTQNQNVQLIKTFIVAFAAMLFAIPVVAVVTTSIVKAQFASIAHAQAAQPVTQTNSLAGPSCAVPADEQQANSTPGGNTAPTWRGAFGPVSQSNSSTINTTTTTNTTNNSVDSRFSGNTVVTTTTIGSNNGNFSNNGNTVNSNNNIGNTVASNNGNAINSGNTVNSNNSVLSDNTLNVNSNNPTTVNDNDGIDIL